MVFQINITEFPKCKGYIIFLIIFFGFLWNTNSFGYSDKSRMKTIPEGCFMMGSNDGHDDEKPSHKVCLTTYLIDAYEVTQNEFINKMNYNPSHFKGENLPVEGVTWKESKKYCSINGKRLPTEAEFEYASRAGSQTKYPWGNKIGINNANCIGCGSLWGGTKTAPVGSFHPNAWGLYDMIGNVWEWVYDWYDSKYPNKAIQNNPTGPDGGTEKVFRSSSWYYLPEYSSVSSRNSYYPNKPFLGVGFRCVK
tara:strand:+ start:1533 stop:2285 length:753 start_codon:yes stop_codon:yes gene_type:complete